MTGNIISVFIFLIILLIATICIISFIKRMIKDENFNKIRKKVSNILLNGIDKSKSDTNNPEYTDNHYEDRTRKARPDDAKGIDFIEENMDEKNMKLEIIVMDGSKEIKRVAINKFPFIFGSTSRADLPVYMGSISPRHFEIKEGEKNILQIKNIPDNDEPIRDEYGNTIDIKSIFNKTVIKIGANIKIIITPLHKYLLTLNNLKPELTFEISGTKQKIFTLTSDNSFTIGRRKTNNIVIDNDYVSREHAEIFYDYSLRAFVFKNISDFNGTFDLLNKKKLKGIETTEVRENSQYYLGKADVKLTVKKIFDPKNLDIHANHSTVDFNDDVRIFTPEIKKQSSAPSIKDNFTDTKVYRSYKTQK